MGRSSQGQTMRGPAPALPGTALAGLAKRPSRADWTPRGTAGFEHLLIQSHAPCRFEPALSPRTEAEAVDEFVRRLIDPVGDREAFTGWAAEAIPDLLAMFTPAARRLGDMWTEDECSFCDVTIGMHRLTLLLIELETQDDHAPQPPHGGCVLITPAPGDQHGFGTALVGLFLRRAGWDVTADVCGTIDAIVSVLQRRSFTIAGFSVGHERAIGPVTDLIRTARARSCNKAIKLAVGGPMIVGNAGLARDMGADLWADDAEALVDRLSGFATASV